MPDGCPAPSLSPMGKKMYQNSQKSKPELPQPTTKEQEHKCIFGPSLALIIMESPTTILSFTLHKGAGLMVKAYVKDSMILRSQDAKASPSPTK